MTTNTPRPPQQWARPSTWSMFRRAWVGTLGVVAFSMLLGGMTLTQTVTAVLGLALLGAIPYWAIAGPYLAGRAAGHKAGAAAGDYARTIADGLREGMEQARQEPALPPLRNDLPHAVPPRAPHPGPAPEAGRRGLRQPPAARHGTARPAPPAGVAMRPLDARDPRYQRPERPQRRPTSNRAVLRGFRHLAACWEYYALAFAGLTAAQAVWPAPTWWVWALTAAAAPALWWARPYWRGGYRNVRRHAPYPDPEMDPIMGMELCRDQELTALYYQLAAPTNGWVDACKFAGEPLATRDMYAHNEAQSRRMALAGIPHMRGVAGKAMSAIRFASTARMALVENGYQTVPIKDACLRATGVAVGVDAGLLSYEGAQRVAPLLAQFFRVPGGCRTRYNHADAVDRTIWFEFLQVDPLAACPRATAPTALLPADTDIPIGVAATGQPVALNLAAQAGHLVLQGVTRSGKSALTYNVLVHAAHMPGVEIWGNDHTNILLGPLGALPGHRAVGPDMEQHVETMGRAVEEMDRRIALLAARGVDKLDDFDADLPVLLYVLEEFPGLIKAAAARDKANGAKPADRLAPQLEVGLSRLVAEGAKVGVRVFLIAQRASANVVDTDSRSNFVARITLRMDNGEGVRMLHADAEPEAANRAKEFSNGRGYFESPWVPFTEWQAHYLGGYSTHYVPALRAAHAARGLPVPGPDAGKGAPQAQP